MAQSTKEVKPKNIAPESYERQAMAEWPTFMTALRPHLLKVKSDMQETVTKYATKPKKKDTALVNDAVKLIQEYRDLVSKQYENYINVWASLVFAGHVETNKKTSNPEKLRQRLLKKLTKQITKPTKPKKKKRRRKPAKRV